MRTSERTSPRHPAVAVRIALALAAAMACGSGTAAEPASWLDEIATIEAQTQLLKKREELRSQLEKASSGTLAALPSVISIIQLDGRAQSQLHFPSGRVSYASVGTMIAPDVRVTAINEHGVEVSITRGKSVRTVPLTFATLQSRYPALYGSGGEDLSKNEAYQNSVLADPPRINVPAAAPASPLPAGMLPAAAQPQGR